MSAVTGDGPHAISVSARNTVQTAFDDLKSIVSSTDSRNFASTTLQDVRKAARDVERQLAARQKSSNLRRLEPLFEGLNHYSKVMEILCNGTPYLPWIWAPIKLVLQVSSDYIEAFRIIIDAYAQIAESLPRFSSLSESLKANTEFQETLAVFYADILRFHEEAYRLVRRSGWKIFFSTTWGRFRRRFEGIISDLNRHAKLVDKEANAYHIHEAHLWRQEARKWRDDSLREIARREKEESVAQFQAVLSWLDVKGAEQEDIFDTYSNETDQYQGTCDWIFKNIKIVSWLRNQPDQPFIWIKGKPGAGKSALLTKIVRSLAQDNQSIVIHHFCSYMHAESTQYGTILRSLITQILRSNDYLLAHVYEEYLLNRKSASPQVLEQLLPTLLSAISNESSRTLYVRIVLDGLDECDEDKQQRVFTVLDRMIASTSNSDQTVCKVLISSQDSPKLSRLLRKKGSVSLYDESTALMSAIGIYVRQRLERMRDDVFPTEHTDADVEEIAEAIESNADGMFLWARLVLDVIQVGIFFSAEDMRTSAIKSIPKDLGEFYQRILDRIVTRFGEQSRERIRAVWGWIALAQRPLKKFELKSALVFGSVDVTGAQLPPDHIFELFKPLIEERKDSSFSFIHISVKNYLQSIASGPFIQQPQVSYEQGLACVACLSSGLNVFQQGYSDNDRLRRVLRGLHGLHLYANEHWIEHLLIAGSQGAGLDTLPNLLGLTERLCNDLQSRRTPLLESTLREGRAPRLDDRLSSLEMHPLIRDYLKFELTCRLQMRLERNGSSINEGSTTSYSHSSPLNDILAGFQETVRRLLQMQAFPGASSEDFERFKRDFRTSAYTCRFIGCLHATVGFVDDRARVEHERSHTQMLNCTFPGCKYDLPFRSTNALKSHMAKYHAPAKNTVIPPRTLRRSRGQSQLLSETAAASDANALLRKGDPRRPRKEENSSTPLSDRETSPSGAYGMPAWRERLNPYANAKRGRQMRESEREERILRQRLERERLERELLSPRMRKSQPKKIESDTPLSDSNPSIKPRRKLMTRGELELDNQRRARIESNASSVSAEEKRERGSSEESQIFATGNDRATRINLFGSTTSSEPAFCMVWEKYIGETGPEWIECGEGWCTGFATMKQRRIYGVQIVVEQDEPFDERLSNDDEDDDILVDSHPIGQFDVMKFAGMRASLANSQVSIQWKDEVTGVNLLLEFLNERDCNDLCSQDGKTQEPKQRNWQDQDVLLLVKKMMSIREINHRSVIQIRRCLGADIRSKKEIKGKGEEYKEQ